MNGGRVPPPGIDRRSAVEGDLEFAVLVPFIERAGEDSILLTKRPATLKRYAGQVAFPGGAREPGDVSLAATALREAHEEVGIGSHEASITAELAWFETGLGHRVKPFVARVLPSARIRPDASEVESVLFLPRRRLVDALFELRPWPDDLPTPRHPQYRFFLEGHEVWGLTARILRALVLDEDREAARADL